MHIGITCLLFLCMVIVNITHNTRCDQCNCMLSYDQSQFMKSSLEVVHVINIGFNIHDEHQQDYNVEFIISMCSLCDNDGGDCIQRAESLVAMKQSPR